MRIKEEEEGLLERGCENEDILKLGEGRILSFTHAFQIIILKKCNIIHIF